MKDVKLVELKFMDLHNPLFLAGTNLGQKLNPKGRTGLKIQHDVNNKWFVISYNGSACLMAETNAVSWEPMDIGDYGLKLAAQTFTRPAFVTSAGSSAMVASIHEAQVETPHSKPRNK